MTLSSQLYELSVRSLHLSARACNCLQHNGVTSVAQTLTLTDAELHSMPRMGTQSRRNIKKTQQSLMASLDGTDIDWFRYWKSLGVRVIPENVDADSRPEEVLVNLPLIIKTILEQLPDQRLWSIIQRRFGLEDTSVLRLEELGIAFDLTRERVRQLEAKAVSELQDVLIHETYAGRDYHVHPQVVEVTRSLVHIAVDEVKQVTREDELLEQIQERFDVDPNRVRPSVFLILKLAGIQELALDNENLESLWGVFSSPEANRVKRAVEKLDVLLTQDFASPVGRVDLLLYLNKGTQKCNRFSLDEVDHLAHLCSSVEEHSEGFYWGKFVYLRGCLNQCERVLIESGEPLHISKITREVNHRLAKAERKVVHQRNLVNQMSNDRRFVAVGKSGEWGLRSWGLNTENIVELIKQCLTVRNESATVDEIYRYVSERRPAQRSSIVSYLTFRDDFAKVDRDRWGLSTWAETRGANTWNPEQVAAFVEGIFKRHGVRKIEYSVLKQALMSEAQANPRQVQGLLAVNPVVQVEKDSKTGESFAIYQSDYREKLKDIRSRFIGTRKTLMQAIAESAQMLLQSAPGQQITLNELVESLANAHDRPARTIYSYVARMDFVEKFRMPNSNQKMCRLSSINREQQSALDQVDNIASVELREKTARALSFLNINDVDVALFLLSKEFEATLGEYLRCAARQGRVHNLPSSTLNLNVMIDFVEKSGIITDKAVLHFLRQKRNDRAHGTMPTDEERRLMMKHAEVTAGMYIDYIKFFDELLHELM